MARASVLRRCRVGRGPRTRRWLCVTIPITLTSFILTSLLLKWRIHCTLAEYKIPTTCTANDCFLQDPLPSVKFSPHLLLILIFSNADKGDGKFRRDAIRMTWTNGLTNQENSPVHYRFVLGIADIDNDQREKLNEEAELYDDMICLEDVKNEYYSLTHRLVKVFQYITKQPWYKFSYVMKCDDDTFVDVRRVASELQIRRNQGRFYWGEMLVGYVQTQGRYKETAWTTCPTYYPYALGGGYVLSGDLIKLLAQNGPHLKEYKSEDVSLASWVSPYNIERRHDSRFNVGAVSKGCKSAYIVTHKISREDMSRLYTSLFHDGSICGPTNSYFRYKGYIYNWTAFPPSRKCCIPSRDAP